MAMNFLPIIAIGGMVLIFGKKKKRRSSKALTPTSTRGTVFEGDSESRPSGIHATVGERFSVSFFSNPSTPASWQLSASPPDNSIRHVSTEVDKIDSEVIGGPDGKAIYIFEGAKPGTGSLVFHLQAPHLDGKEPPSEVVEILTEIS